MVKPQWLANFTQTTRNSPFVLGKNNSNRMGGGSGTGSEGTRQAWSLQFVGLDHELVGFG
jgi:hypothetical protein